MFIFCDKPINISAKHKSYFDTEPKKLHVSAFSNLSPGFIGMIFQKPEHVIAGFISKVMCLADIGEDIDLPYTKTKS
jgi:hypothetical protein